MQYRIWEGAFEQFDKKIKRIVNKCKKYGNPFTYEVIGDVYETRVERVSGIKRENTYRFTLVDVEGTAKIGDWELIAVMEYSHAGNIIKNINNDIMVPERFKTSDAICEHCGSKRVRKKSVYHS